MNPVIEYLEKVVSDVGGELKPPYENFHHFVLANGREYRAIALLRQYKSFFGELGCCYSNTLTLVRCYPSNLTYVEGFAAVRDDHQISVHWGLHAWAADGNGNAVDTTWDDTVDYFGVPFRLDYVWDVYKRRKETGVIDNWNEKFPLLKDRAKGWRADVQTGTTKK